jgi:hypothetical protein
MSTTRHRERFTPHRERFDDTEEDECLEDCEAARFLKMLREPSWVLTAIDPDDREPTVTITAKTPEAVLEFVAKYNGRYNLYYHVNPAKWELRKKAKKEDIKEALFLFVDCDPRPNEKPARAHARYEDAIAKVKKSCRHHSWSTRATAFKPCGGSSNQSRRKASRK